MDRENSDKLLINIEGRFFALELSEIARIVTTERVFLMPQAAPPVEGVIADRGEPLVVLNLKTLFGNSGKAAGPYAIIITRDGKRVLGLYGGAERLNFLWKKDQENGVFKPAKERFTKGVIELSGSEVSIVDCGALYNEASNILSQRG